MGNLVDFYRNQIPTPEGLMFSDFCQYGYEQFEADHAWIQWILPTKDRSAFNINSPLLTDEDISTFKSDSVLIGNYIYSIYRVVDFFGMTVFKNEVIWQMPGNHKNPKWWLDHFNHNFLRMTRLLESLKYMGYDEFALSILGLLEEYKDKYQNSFEEHWKPAVY